MALAHPRPPSAQSQAMSQVTMVVAPKGEVLRFRRAMARRTIDPHAMATIFVMKSVARQNLLAITTFIRVWMLLVLPLIPAYSMLLTGWAAMSVLMPTTKRFLSLATMPGSLGNKRRVSVAKKRPPSFVISTKSAIAILLSA